MASILLLLFFFVPSSFSSNEVNPNELVATAGQRLTRIFSTSNFLETSQCARDLQTWANDALLTSTYLLTCRNISHCLSTGHFLNKAYALQYLASIGIPRSLDMQNMGSTWPGSHEICDKYKSRSFESTACYVHVNVDWDGLDLAVWRIEKPRLPIITEKCGLMSGMNLKIGACLPRSCRDNQDIATILSNVTDGHLHLCGIDCIGPVRNKGFVFWAVNIGLTSLVALVMASSWMEDSSPRLRAFSLRSNLTEIFAIKDSTANGRIGCLDALRTICLTSVVFGHLTFFEGDAINGMTLLRSNVLVDLLGNAHATVDTYLFMGGLVVGMTFFQNVRRDPGIVRRPATWFFYYAHRWIRLTPAYVAFLFVYIAWAPQMHGPRMAGSLFNVSMLVESCERRWWTNALYVNNFVEMYNDRCYPPAWYLAVDTQLYFAAPLLLVAFAYSPIAGMATASLAVALSTSLTFILTYTYDLPAVTITAKSFVQEEFNRYLYIKPWIRGVPYVAGVVVGYVVVLLRGNPEFVKKRLPITRIHGSIAWLISLAFALFVGFAARGYTRGHVDWSPAIRAGYGATARIAWSATMSWLVLACTFEWTSGTLRSILEYPAWQPFGRLSYSAFLVHFFALQYFFNEMDGPSYHSGMWRMFLESAIPATALSYIGGLAWALLVEWPSAKLGSHFIAWLKKHPSDSPPQLGNTAIAT